MITLMMIKQEIIRRVQEVITARPDAVPFAFLFGSFANDRQTSRSDIDLAFYFQGISEEEKTEIEHKVSLLFDEAVHVLRLEDEDISPAVRLEAVSGLPIITPDIDRLNDFILSIIHQAEEHKHLMERLKRVA